MGFVEPCIPTLSQKPPVGPQWVHEIKHDGYRVIACRRGGYLRLFTRRGYDCSHRYPLIRESLAALPADAIVDGEAVVCGDKGIADFALLHGRRQDRRATLYAFDLLELDGRDLRALSLEERKSRLYRLLEGVPAGIQYNDHLERDGAEFFDHACKLGFEGIVSKDRRRPYRSGPSKAWLKIKNPNAPGTLRFKDP